MGSVVAEVACFPLLHKIEGTQGNHSETSVHKTTSILVSQGYSYGLLEMLLPELKIKVFAQ
jgi:hypothetical protein